MHPELRGRTIRGYAFARAAIKRLKRTSRDAVRATLQVPAGPGDFTVTRNATRLEPFPIKAATSGRSDRAGLAATAVLEQREPTLPENANQTNSS